MAYWRHVASWVVVVIGSCKGISPILCQAITRTNANLLSFGHLGKKSWIHPNASGFVQVDIKGNIKSPHHITSPAFYEGTQWWPVVPPPTHTHTHASQATLKAFPCYGDIMGKLKWKRAQSRKIMCPSMGTQAVYPTTTDENRCLNRSVNIKCVISQFPHLTL